jgi:two-component system, sensor histidine kinase PdtaS
MGILTPVFDDSVNEYDRARFSIAWRLLFLFLFIFAFLTFAFRHSSAVAFGIYLTVFVLTVVSTLYVHFSKNYLAPYYIFSFSASALLTYSFVFLDNTLHYPDFFWIIATILFAFIGLGKKWALFFILYHVGTIFYFFMFTLNRNLSNATQVPKDQLIGIMIEMVVGLLVISYLFYIYLKFKDFFEKELKTKNENLEIKNRLIEQKNHENLTLLKEVHHRVKNNLQIVVSLLRMQSNEIDDRSSKGQFDEAIARIMTISTIHQKLYEQKNLSEIDLFNYLNSLLDEISKLHNTKIKTTLEIEGSIKSLGLRSVVPLGLIINELITNSVKHHTNDEMPEVKLHFLSTDNSMITFQYSDNGIWSENNKDQKFRFGTELIEILTEQMEGSVIRQGTAYLFKLKNLDH